MTVDVRVGGAEHYPYSEACQTRLRQRAGQVRYVFEVLPYYESQKIGGIESGVPAGYALYAQQWWIARNPTTGHYYEMGESRKLAEVPGTRAVLQRTADHLTALVEQGNLAAALQWAEKLAVAHGFLDPQSGDRRLFYADPVDNTAVCGETEHITQSYGAVGSTKFRPVNVASY